MMINHLIQPFLVDYYFYKLLQSTNILIWFLLGVYKQTLITIVICVSFQVYSLIIWINLSLDGNWSLRLWLFVVCMVLVMWPTWGEKKIWFVTLMTALWLLLFFDKLILIWLCDSFISCFLNKFRSVCRTMINPVTVERPPDSSLFGLSEQLMSLVV